MSEFDIRDVAGSAGALAGKVAGPFVTWVLDNWFKLVILVLAYKLVADIHVLVDYIDVIGTRYYEWTAFMKEFIIKHGSNTIG